MRIERLTLTDFLAHERTEVNLAPVTLLVGPNGAGKSSVLQALAALRYGKARGVLQKDAAALTRAGGKRWAVEASIDGQVVRRTASTSSHSQAALDEMFGDPRVWQALLDVATFPGLSPKDRQVLVSDLTASDTSALVARLTELGAGWEILSATKAGDLRKAHRLATEARREADRQVTWLNSQLAAEPRDPEVETREGLRRVSTLSMETLGRAEVAIRAAILETDRRAQERDRQANVRLAAQDAWSALAALPRTTWTEEDERNLEALQARLAAQPQVPADLAARRQDLVARRAQALRDRDEAERTVVALRALIEQEGDCPTCGQGLGPAKARAEQEVERLLGVAANADRAREEAEAALAGVTEEIRRIDTAARDAASGAREDLRSLQARQRQVGEVRVQRARLEQQVAAADALTPVPADEPGKDRASLDLSLERVRTAIAARGVYDEALRQRQEAEARVATATKDAARLAEIEDAVRPDRAEGLGQALDQVNATLAQRGPVLFGAPAVTITPTWEVEVWGRPWGLASRSEQYRAGVLISVALARLAGLGVLVLDDAESLDEVRRNSLVQLLAVLHEAGEIQTAIVASAQARRDVLRPPPVEWCRMYWVEGGKVTAVPSATPAAAAAP